VAGRRAARHWNGEHPLSLDPLLAAEAPGVDVILVEGFRRSSLPKIEVVRQATARAPVALKDPSVVGVVTDTDSAHDASIPRFGFDDLAPILALVKKAMGLPS
ncbi:MAG: molybdopterin-guanine dinucleotide biosynthesis protein MobB, partial [Thermoanaerobaculia bacterium]